MNHDEYASFDAVGLAALVRSGEISAREVLIKVVLGELFDEVHLVVTKVGH